jgi:hypothetical protein
MLFVRLGILVRRFAGYFTTRQLNRTTAAPKAAQMKSTIGELERAIIIVRW